MKGPFIVAHYKWAFFILKKQFLFTGINFYYLKSQILFLLNYLSNLIHVII